jgi:hypothetical protein
MPTQNTEGNMIIMYWTNEGNKEESQLGNKVELGDMYFYYNDTTEYFPTMRYNSDYVPLG